MGECGVGHHDGGVASPTQGGGEIGLAVGLFLKPIGGARHHAAEGAVFVVHEVTFRHFSGAAASAAALGSLGFFAAAFSDNAIAGYMASLIYYIANFFLKQKLGVFFLFSMTFGSFSEKKWLIILSLVLIAAAFSVRKFRE